MEVSRPEHLDAASTGTTDRGTSPQEAGNFETALLASGNRTSSSSSIPEGAQSVQDQEMPLRHQAGADDLHRMFSEDAGTVQDQGAPLRHQAGTGDLHQMFRQGSNGSLRVEPASPEQSRPTTPSFLPPGMAGGHGPYSDIPSPAAPGAAESRIATPETARPSAAAPDGKAGAAPAQDVGQIEQQEKFQMQSARRDAGNGMFDTSDEVFSKYPGIRKTQSNVIEVKRMVGEDIGVQHLYNLALKEGGFH